MNNQGRNFPTSSWIGNSRSTPQPQHPNPMNMSQQRNHTSHLISSQLHPHAPFRGHFQPLDPLTMLFAQQAQYSQLHQATQAQLHGHYQAQSFSQLHNANATNNANANANANVDATFVPSSSNARSSKRPITKSAPQRKMELHLPEMQVQEKVANQLLPESLFYTKLLDYDAKIDAALENKKIEVQECIMRHPLVQKTLRIYVLNTFTNQVKASSTALPFSITTPYQKDEEEASWSLKIIGRILEDDNKDPATLQTNPKFSTFFKRVSIYLDASLYPDDHVIVWENALSLTQIDAFEVKRKGNKEFIARVKLEMNYTPEKFVLSKQLNELLGMEFETHPRVMDALWNYVYSRKLQNPNNHLIFNCDPPLQRVFGAEKMHFQNAGEKLLDHLSRPPPIQLEHRIKLSGDPLAGISCYDVLVDMPFTLEKKMAQLMDLKNNKISKEVEAYDEKIRASFKELNERRKRRALFLGFSQSPQDFVNASVDSLSKGLNHASGSANHSKDSHFYNQPWVEDAAIRYLNSKTDGSNSNRENSKNTGHDAAETSKRN